MSLDPALPKFNAVAFRDLQKKIDALTTQITAYQTLTRRIRSSCQFGLSDSRNSCSQTHLEQNLRARIQNRSVLYLFDYVRSF